MSNKHCIPDDAIQATVPHLTETLASTPVIEILVSTDYLPEQSIPESLQYVFSYTITITNQAEIPITLLSRHWVIMDANGNIREIQGVGVVGKQPVLQPGTTFEYSSGVILETPVGSMHGHYELCYRNGLPFTANIVPFRLAMPDLVH